jgi:hypothetical protein
MGKPATARHPSARIVAVAVLALLPHAAGCGRRPGPRPDPTPATSASSPTSTSSALVIHAEPSARPSSAPSSPLPTPPPLACTPSTPLAFRQSPESAFSCSPFKTGDAPLTPTLAPGTTLEIPLDVVEVPTSADAGDEPRSVAKLTYRTAGLPKNARLDETSRVLRWRTQASDGADFAFTIAADADGGCVSTRVIVRLRDDADTRMHQVQRLVQQPWIDALRMARTHAAYSEAEAAGDLGSWDRRTKTAMAEIDRDVACGELFAKVKLIDLDGDGQLDGLSVIANRVEHDPGETYVYQRRGDTYYPLAHFGGATSPEKTPTGATLLVYHDFCCGHDALEIYEVFPNRVESIAKARVANDACGSFAPGIEFDHDASGALIRYAETDTDATGKRTTKRWKWGKTRFVLEP